MSVSEKREKLLLWIKPANRKCGQKRRRGVTHREDVIRVKNPEMFQPLTQDQRENLVRCLTECEIHSVNMNKYLAILHMLGTKPVSAPLYSSPLIICLPHQNLNPRNQGCLHRFEQLLYWSCPRQQSTRWFLGSGLSQFRDTDRNI